MHYHFGGDFALLAAWATMEEGILKMCRRGVTRIIMTPQFAESTKLVVFKGTDCVLI
jgi:hypothetical protein